MNIRQVKLYDGPCDGMASVASHDTAFCQNECYVHDGGEDPNRFVHLETALRKLDPDQRDEEYIRVRKWLGKHGAPLADLLGIPPWRINAWIVALRNDILV